MKRINKRIARKLFETNQPFVIVGDNVNEYHILGGWHCGIRVDPTQYKIDSMGISLGSEAFDTFVNDFESYLERELGRHAAFYTL